MTQAPILALIVLLATAQAAAKEPDLRPTQAAQAQLGPRFIYVCDGAPPFAIRFHTTTPPSAHLQSGAAQFKLTAQPAASGARYAGGGIEFWGKGQEAMLTGADGVRHACRVAHQIP